ncbi:MAG: hypothetical protein Q8O19_06485 [Rectinemataceae bacterium]|nr:hypothetical protein [Rectinemataceae bacterium]
MILKDFKINAKRLVRLICVVWIVLMVGYVSYVRFVSSMENEGWLFMGAVLSICACAAYLWKEVSV